MSEDEYDEGDEEDELSEPEQSGLVDEIMAGAERAAPAPAENAATPPTAKKHRACANTPNRKRKWPFRVSPRGPAEVRAKMWRETLKRADSAARASYKTREIVEKMEERQVAQGAQIAQLGEQQRALEQKLARLVEISEEQLSIMQKKLEFKKRVFRM